jgi:hypothetical protein
LLPARYTELPEALEALEADERWPVAGFTGGAREAGGLSHGGKAPSVDKWYCASTRWVCVLSGVSSSDSRK